MVEGVTVLEGGAVEADAVHFVQGGSVDDAVVLSFSCQCAAGSGFLVGMQGDAVGSRRQRAFAALAVCDKGAHVACREHFEGKRERRLAAVAEVGAGAAVAG